MNRYSPNQAEDDLIETLIASYGSKTPRSLCMERDWSEDGADHTAARPYSRVRTVKTYDAHAWCEAGMPINYAPFEIGIKLEAW